MQGFRKFFKTNAEWSMRTYLVEKLMGHAENYDRPPLDYPLNECLKAVPHLTISEARHLKNEMERKIASSDKRVGGLEKMERSYNELRQPIERAADEFALAH